MNKAAKNGEGATVFKGRMVDLASIKQAEVLVKLANLIENG
jgi:malyl-CoA/(S)-citramalyl-CoA lyase